MLYFYSDLLAFKKEWKKRIRKKTKNIDVFIRTKNEKQKTEKKEERNNASVRTKGYEIFVFFFFLQ